MQGVGGGELGGGRGLGVRVGASRSWGEMRGALYLFIIYRGRVSWSLGWPRTHSIGEDGLDLSASTLRLGLPWCVPPCAVYLMLGIKPRASHVLGKQCTKLHP